jgi:hypothetical protein
MLSVLAVAMVVATADAAENDVQKRADAMTWPVSSSSEPTVGAVLGTPEPPRPSEHADAITWECPRSRVLTH